MVLDSFCVVPFFCVGLTFSCASLFGEFVYLVASVDFGARVVLRRLLGTPEKSEAVGLFSTRNNCWTLLVKEKHTEINDCGALLRALSPD